MTAPTTVSTAPGRRARGVLVLLAGIAMASALSGCISLGGGSPPSKTYVVVPQGSTLQPAQ